MLKGIYFASLPQDLPWSERLELAKKAGYDGVELTTMDDLNECKKVKKIADDIGIALPSVMDAMHWKCPQSSPDANIRQQGLDNLKKSLETASIVGADTILLVPGVVSEDVSYEDAYNQALESMEDVKALAEEYKIVVGLENVWNKFLLSPLEFRDFLDKVDSEYIKAYFDVGNIILYGFPEQWIYTLGERIHKVHVKNFLRSTYTFTHLLYGDVNWPKVIKALRDIGYDSYLTAELPNYNYCNDQMIYDTAQHLDRIIQL
ncbi:MAG: sugar phosphate isomerase/epimerase [Clostridiales bacterium]|nr:sugar phosphate isomerase/epimerase [Clostridiales bacterium]